jgi:hypothetical protein
VDLLDTSLGSKVSPPSGEALRRTEPAPADEPVQRGVETSLMPSRTLTQAETSVKANLVNTNVYTISLCGPAISGRAKTWLPLRILDWAHGVNLTVTDIVDNMLEFFVKTEADDR